MKRSTIALAIPLFLALTGLVGCGSSDTEEEPAAESTEWAVGEPVCEAACKPKVLMNCGRVNGEPNWDCVNPALAACEQACQSKIDLAPWCREVTRNAYTCLARSEPASWELADDGNVRSTTTCQDWFQAAVNCWNEGLPENMDVETTCRLYCKNLEGLDCVDEAGCYGGCVAAIENGVGGNHACRGAIFTMHRCFATMLSPSDFYCDEKSGLNVSSGACGAQLQQKNACVSAAEGGK